MKAWVLVLLLFSPWSLAQQEDAPPAEEPSAEEATEQRTDREQSAEAGDNEEGEENEEELAPRDGDSPEDFIPTQQISEDLSVSFPVDI